MKFKKLSVLFCSLLALTSVMAVSAAETETVSETEAASEEESTVSGADEETEYPITIQHAYGETVINRNYENCPTPKNCYYAKSANSDIFYKWLYDTLNRQGK